MAPDGTRDRYSLCAVLAKADELMEIECPSPGQKVAVIELLLAICFASGTCPSSDEDWYEWIVGGRDLGPVAVWLAEQPDDAWDLFHPSTPLMQNSRLALDLVDNGTGTAQLVLEHAGDYNQHFDHHHLERGEPLLAADAFRAMLAQHTYGPSGRARMSGDRLGLKVTNLAAGRLVGRIRVVARGRTLGETLRLNLYPFQGPTGNLNTSWTMDGVTRREFKDKAKPRIPQGPADLHSALGRSVLLRPKQVGVDIVVDKVLIGAGEILEHDPERHLQDAVFTTVAGVKKPLRPSPTRRLWTEAHALYCAVKDQEHGLYARLYSLPYERKSDVVPYWLWAVGFLTNKALPLDWTDGSYPYAPGMAAHLYEASRGGSDIAEYIARSLKEAAEAAVRELFPAALVAEETAQVARLDARKFFWPAAESPFDEMLREVAVRGPEDHDPVSEPLTEYARELMATAEKHLVRLLQTLPRNDVSHRARARAVRKFKTAMASDRAPAGMRGEFAHD